MLKSSFIQNHRQGPHLKMVGESRKECREHVASSKGSRSAVRGGMDTQAMACVDEQKWIISKWQKEPSTRIVWKGGRCLGVEWQQGCPHRLEAPAFLCLLRPYQGGIVSLYVSDFQLTLKIKFTEARWIENGTYIYFIHVLCDTVKKWRYAKMTKSTMLWKSYQTV